MKSREGGLLPNYKMPNRAEYARALLRWYARHKRDLPWRQTRDPYRIWLSEILLQQTRVAAALPYYERFLARFPCVEALAEAPEPELLTLWAGLGYYTRAHNMQRAARQVVAGGAFPSTYDAIRALPGVGDYTAAAVASIAFHTPVPVVDGNVFRVLSRLFADPTDISSSGARSHFGRLAATLLDRKNPGQFNQAVMELGATVCLPKSPQCLLCPLASLCAARARGTQTDFPVKSRKPKQVREERTLLWIEERGRILAWQRPPDSRLMKGFWELPEPVHLPGISAGQTVGTFRHGITFHHYVFTVVEAIPPAHPHACQWVPLEQLGALPVSTIFRKALRTISKVN